MLGNVMAKLLKCGNFTFFKYCIIYIGKPIYYKYNTYE